MMGVPVDVADSEGAMGHESTIFAANEPQMEPLRLQFAAAAAFGGFSAVSLGNHPVDRAASGT